MSGDTGQTAFVTGATGFIGSELVKVLVTRGYRVFGLARSVESAQHLRRAGAVAVRGDLLVPGKWQDEAVADWVFHIPPRRPIAGRHGAQGRAGRIAGARAAMDSHLLDAISSAATRRIVYAADANCYGPTGSRPVTEDELPTAATAGPRGACPTPALERVEGYVIAGLPVVTALPGCVYGNTAWLREEIVAPVMAGRRVKQFGDPGPWVSPIHVHDCARALIHLAERGDVGSRYFLADSEPVRLHEFARTVARLTNRPLRTWRIPSTAARLFVGHPLAGFVEASAALSNIRLRGIGFQFCYPTLERGIEQVLGMLHE